MTREQMIDEAVRAVDVRWAGNNSLGARHAVQCDFCLAGFAQQVREEFRAIALAHEPE